MQNHLAASVWAALTELCVHCKNYREISVLSQSTLYNPPRSWFLVKSPTMTGARAHQCMQAKDLRSTRSHLGLISKRISDNHSPLSY